MGDAPAHALAGELGEPGEPGEPGGAWANVDIYIRPVTEPWDIGTGAKPAGVDTRRYMVLRKATAGTETGATLRLPPSARRSPD